MYKRIDIYTSIYVYTFVHIYILKCRYIYIYIYTYIHIYIPDGRFSERQLRPSNDVGEGAFAALFARQEYASTQRALDELCWAI